MPFLLLSLLLYGGASGLASKGRVYIPVQYGETVRVWCQGKVVEFTDSQCRSKGACYKDFSYHSNLPVQLTCIDGYKDKNLTISTTVTRQTFRSANIEVLSESSIRIECLVPSGESKLNLKTTYPLMRWASDTRGTTGDIASNQYNYMEYYFLESRELSKPGKDENCNGTVYSYEMLIGNSTRFTTPPWQIKENKTIKANRGTIKVALATMNPMQPMVTERKADNSDIVGLSSTLFATISSVISVTVLIICISLTALYCKKHSTARPTVPARSPTPPIHSVYPTSLNEPLVGIVPTPPCISTIPLYDDIVLEREDLEAIYNEIEEPNSGRTPVFIPSQYESTLRLTPSSSPTPPYICPDGANTRWTRGMSECENEYTPVVRPVHHPEGYCQLNSPAPREIDQQAYEYASLPGGRLDDGYRYNVLRRDGTDDDDYQYNVLRRN